MLCTFISMVRTLPSGKHQTQQKQQQSVLVYDGDVLPLTKVSRNEMGAYLCIATNGVPPSVSKRIILDVEFSPMIWVPNQLVGAPAGTDVTIDCHTEAHPKAIIYWVYNSVMVLPSKKYKTDYTENSYRAHMKLTIRNLQYGDFGNYRCISKNSLGETEGSIRVYEIPLPSTPSKQVTHTTVESRESNIIPSLRNDTTKSLQTDVYAMKNDLYAGGTPGSSSAGSGSSAASSSSMQTSLLPGGGTAGNSLSALSGGSKNSLAIGKSVFYTERPPNEYSGSTVSVCSLCPHFVLLLMLLLLLSK
ncbi:interference hedgehog isoform X3 [Drosophila grimshawi]|uniref:interference hedgehog isoform X3 n=1 Tax=Drosophila grimshawi TaxID=7222 RepID=UPI001C936AA9|nr:interference hedgehog isoform X3 [Drosophila grimshawi]